MVLRILVILKKHHVMTILSIYRASVVHYVDYTSLLTFISYCALFSCYGPSLPDANRAYAMFVQLSRFGLRPSLACYAALMEVYYVTKNFVAYVLESVVWITLMGFLWICCLNMWVVIVLVTLVLMLVYNS